MITREFNLYLHAGHSIPLVINANQYDHGEQWLFKLFNSDGTQYVPSSGAIVGIKSDNLGIINSGTVDSQGRVVINETQQMTAAVGKAVFELVIDDGTHGTANFVVLIEPKPGDNADLSESDISMIEEAVEAAANIKPYGSPLVASTVAGMTDHDKVYVYVGSETGYTSGHWYYYDGDSWEDGGVYNSVAVQTDTTLTLSGVAADAKKTGDEINDLKSQIAQSTGMSNDFKVALENLLMNVGFRGDDPTGRTYLNALHTAMYPPANLTRIEAVYTQSGDVYDTDTLDSLRDDLVVTAYYDNATSEVISSYTLSGTLAEGTSTVTVSYGGKTTTFTVTVLTGFVYTPAKGLLSAQSGITGTNLSAFTESIVDGALRLYSPKVSTESTGSYEFDDVTFTNSLYVKLIFKAVSIASISASNTGHYGSPRFQFGDGTGFAIIGFGTTPNVASRIRYYNRTTMSFIPITLDEWHTVELSIESEKQTITLDGAVVANSVDIYPSASTAKSLAVANSKNSAIDFYIQRLEIKGE